jgi:Icc-related predicted phosphoesterase
MRILVASDLHYRLPHYDWLVEQALHFDVIALPGDHLDVAGAVPLDAQIVVLRSYFERLSSATVLLTTSGNHDLDGPGDHGEQIPAWLRRAAGQRIHVDNDVVDIGTTRFTLCPWWDGPVTKLEVDAQLARDAADRPERWVWLYHSPPAGTGLCRTGRREFPDHDLLNWIERWQPDLVFTGHIHQAPWVDGGAWSARIGRTWVFNAGRQSGPLPSHVIIDTDAGTADWIGLPEFGRIALDDVIVSSSDQ